MAAKDYVPAAMQVVQRPDHASDESYCMRVWELAEHVASFEPAAIVGAEPTTTPAATPSTKREKP